MLIKKPVGITLAGFFCEIKLRSLVLYNLGFVFCFLYFQTNSLC